jgi:hypothetical protein
MCFWAYSGVLSGVAVIRIVKDKGMKVKKRPYAFKHKAAFKQTYCELTSFFGRVVVAHNVRVFS